MKEKPQNVHLKLIFCHVLDRFNLSYANCFLGLTYGFFNKNFQEIKLFICHCSFHNISSKSDHETTDREWYTFRIEFLFIFSFITCHLRFLQCEEFKNFCSFAVRSVLFFFQNLCPEYITIIHRSGGG